MNYQRELQAKYKVFVETLEPSAAQSLRYMRTPDQISPELFNIVYDSGRNTTLEQDLELFCSTVESQDAKLKVSDVKADREKKTIVVTLVDAARHLIAFVPYLKSVRTEFNYRVLKNDDVLTTEELNKLHPHTAIKEVVPNNLIRVYTPNAVVGMSDRGDYPEGINVSLEFPFETLTTKESVDLVITDFSYRTRHEWCRSFYSPVAMRIVDEVRNAHRVLINQRTQEGLEKLRAKLAEDYSSRML
jgi:hypothetical protein